MPKYRYDGLVAALRDRFGDDLRWVTNYNSETYDYRFPYIRENLETELSGVELDQIVHRALAVFNKRHTEEVYFHLGESNYLVANYERGTAFHLFLDDVRGVTIMLEPDVSVSLPEFVEECRDEIETV